MIPVGEENAATARLLWKQLDLWSFASIKHKLNEMAVAGLIQRKRVMREARLTSLYYRPRGGQKARLIEGRGLKAKRKG
jgi:hypothetical protein